MDGEVQVTETQEILAAALTERVMGHMVYAGLADMMGLPTVGAISSARVEELTWVINLLLENGVLVPIRSEEEARELARSIFGDSF